MRNESGYGSEPGYRGDVEFGYGDEYDDEEEDVKLLFWGGYVNDEIHQAESLNVKTQTWEPAPSPELEVKVDRAVSTSIFFLLPSGNVSRLHRIPMAETWHFYLGEPLTVVEIHDDGKLKFTCLGPDLIEGDQKPQYTVPPNIWFGSFPTKRIFSF